MISPEPPTDEEQYARLKTIKKNLVHLPVVQMDAYREVLKIEKELRYRMEKRKHH